jgi:hypothetical protein
MGTRLAIWRNPLSALVPLVLFVAAVVARQATCDELLKQADTAMAAHKGDAKAATAKEQRAKGEAACKAGEFAKGSEHLRRAITDLGMKPVN